MFKKSFCFIFLISHIFSLEATQLSKSLSSHETADIRRQDALTTLPTCLQKECMYLHLLPHKNLRKLCSEFLRLEYPSMVLFPELCGIVREFQKAITGSYPFVCFAWSSDSKYLAYCFAGSEQNTNYTSSISSEKLQKSYHIKILDTTTDKEPESFCELVSDIPVHAISWAQDSSKISVHMGKQKLTMPYSGPHNFLCTLPSTPIYFKEIIIEDETVEQVTQYSEYTHTCKDSINIEIEQRALKITDYIVEKSDLPAPDYIQTILFSPDGTKCAAIEENDLYSENIALIMNTEILKLTLKQLQRLERIFLKDHSIEIHLRGFLYDFSSLEISSEDLAQFPILWQKAIISRLIFLHELHDFYKIGFFMQWYQSHQLEIAQRHQRSQQEKAYKKNPFI